jgi:hypothetical protein
MAVNTDIMVRFLADSKGVTDEVGKVEGTGSKLASWAKKSALAIGGAFAATKVAQFAKDAVDAASNLNESVSKTGVVFGQSATDIENWSKTSATSIGLSQQAALEAAGTYGNLAVSLGLPQDQAAAMSKSLVGLAGDLASFNNVPVDEALGALQSGLTGETEPLKKFGVNMNEATLKAQAMAMGLSDGKTPLDASAKAQAAYALIMKQTTTAQGDFARTSDGLANQQRIAAAQTENMKAALGQALLPVIQAVVQILNDYLIPILSVLAGFLEKNSSWLVPLAAAIALVVAAVKVWTLVQAAFNVVMDANPIMLVVLAIAALVAGIIWAYQNVGWFRDLVDAAFSAVATAFGWITDAAKTVFDWLTDHWPLILAILTGPFGVAVLEIVKNWDAIKSGAQAVWDFIKDTFSTLAGYITAPFTTAWDTISTVWENIKGGATAVYDWVKTKFDDLVKFVEGIVTTITTTASDIANGLKAPINAVIRAFNGIRFDVPSFTLPSFDVGPVHLGGQTVGGWTIDFPNIPELAKGGIITGPTLAMLGERGAEAVVPLHRGLGQSRVYNLNVSVAAGTDPAVTGRAIVQLIQAYERGNGSQWRSAS